MTDYTAIQQKVFENPAGWSSFEVKQDLVSAWSSWVSDLEDWKVFITLTFRDDKTGDVARSLFQWFVRFNNQALLGKHYTRIVGHSYFSYLLGIEYQRRDVIHFHVLIDQPVKYDLIHSLWGERCGFAWIDGKMRDRQKVINYVCKYIVKGGEVELYRKKKSFVPDPLPVWWCLSRAVSEPPISGTPEIGLPLTNENG